ncbi:Hypothetical protein NTJ_09068 [Nesidiocoris tenuis]|uniref:Secreted protein n=1 Tax=Nesidiocoris tenuis TaxID=355587 RepID=A0ABN7AXK1_9HEMI|nr:Hypothetical protein NTJ_09068 [Nesidiocoris tenuis]
MRFLVVTSLASSRSSPRLASCITAPLHSPLDAVRATFSYDSRVDVARRKGGPRPHLRGLMECATRRCSVALPIDRNRPKPSWLKARRRWLFMTVANILSERRKYFDKRSFQNYETR